MDQLRSFISLCTTIVDVSHDSLPLMCYLLGNNAVVQLNVNKNYKSKHSHRYFRLSLYLFLITAENLHA